MESALVYQKLFEIFPQVDSRILKAVALEHFNDCDAAAEFILYEVIPSLSGPSELRDTVQYTDAVFNEGAFQPREEHDVNNQGAESVQPKSISHGNTLFHDSSNFTSHLMEKSVEIVNVDPSISHGDALFHDSSSFTSHLLGKSIGIIDVDPVSSNSEHSSLPVPTVDVDSVSNILPFLEANGKNIINLDADNHYSFSNMEENLDLGKNISNSAAVPEKQLLSHLVEFADAASASSQSSYKALSVVDENHTDSASKNIDDAFDGSEEYQSACIPNHQSEMLECNNESVSVLGKDLPMLVPTRSGHVIAIDLLEDCVTDAKSSKKILVSSVESVVNMIKEAELLEERAKQAKEKAFSAGQDTFAKVDELKHMLQHANQANDMHAGEILGEKSILSTEARELQSRLLNMADERDKSFLLIEEIQEKLETRLLAAKDEIAVAEKEKLEKEGLALKALKEQEAIMESIVQESKKLQVEAEENAKLRVFLVDTSRVVDTLQGEIAIICEDVLLLKKRVDEHAPLKGSLLVTPYSSVSSASSSFSHKSVLSTNEVLPEELANNTVSDGDDFVNSREQENIFNFNDVEKVGISSWKEKSISDDEWEILRNEVGQF